MNCKRPRKAVGFYEHLDKYGNLSNGKKLDGASKEDIQRIEKRASSQDQGQDYGETKHLVVYEDDINDDSNDIYTIERVVKTQSKGGKTEYLCLWHGYPKEDASWVPSTDVTTEVIESYENPHPSSDVIQDAVGNFTLAINDSLKKGASREFKVAVVFRHDVFRYLFSNKTQLNVDDFSSSYFKVGWDQGYHNYRADDEYNNGHRLEYPVLARPYLKWMKNAHCTISNVMIKKNRSFVEMVEFKIKKINC